MLLCRICGTLLPGAAERRHTLGQPTEGSFAADVDREVGAWRSYLEKTNEHTAPPDRSQLTAPIATAPPTAAPGTAPAGTPTGRHELWAPDTAPTPTADPPTWAPDTSPTPSAGSHTAPSAPSWAQDTMSLPWLPTAGAPTTPAGRDDDERANYPGVLLAMCLVVVVLGALLLFIG